MTEAASYLERVKTNYSRGLDNYCRHYGDLWPVMLKSADQVISQLQAVPPAKILDLACGGGSVTTAIALKGFEITGIDCTPGAIDLATKMSGQKGARVLLFKRPAALICRVRKSTLARTLGVGGVIASGQGGCGHCLPKRRRFTKWFNDFRKKQPQRGHMFRLCITSEGTILRL